MNVKEISNQELVTRLLELRGHERQITVQILRYLIELEDRRLYAELGYASMFDYCVRRLGYSEASAYRRISASRVLRDNPELEALIFEGKVNLCSIASAAKSIQSKRTELSEIVNKSTREVQRLVAPEVSKPKEKIVPFVVKKEPLSLPIESPEERRYELKFSVGEEVYRSFEVAKSELSNALGQNLTCEGVMTKLLEHYLKPKIKQSTSNPDNRYVPLRMRREVRIRDSYQCTYVAPDGTRCTEKRYLQFDHVKPVALGGRSESQNLRLMCPAHNQLLARQVFGAELQR